MPMLLTLALALQIAAVPSGPTQSAADSQLAQAEARYRTAIAASPAIAAYHESLALILEREGRLDDALASHRQAVTLDSLALRQRAGLGALLLRMGRAAEAIPHLQAASRLDRGSVDVRKLLAAALLQQSRRAEAIAALREAARLDSTDVDVRRTLATAQTSPAGADSGDVGAARHRLASQTARQVLQGIFAIVLGVAGLVLLAPLLSGLALLFIQLPRHLVKETVT